MCSAYPLWEYWGDVKYVYVQLGKFDFDYEIKKKSLAARIVRSEVFFYKAIVVGFQSK